MSGTDPSAGAKASSTSASDNLAPTNDPSSAVQSVSSPLSSTQGSTKPDRITPAGSPGLLIEDKFVKLLNSEAGVDSLLLRLKKSVNTCEELAKYIKKKAGLEQTLDEHLKKISSTTQDIFKGGNNLKSDSFTQNFDKMLKIDERIASTHSAYCKHLTQMYNELSSLSSLISSQRKQIKESFKKKEKEVIDALNSADKARSKYFQLCNELERVRTNDPNKKTFTLKGAKTSSEQDDVLQRKIEIADSDYRQKVLNSKGLRTNFLNNLRPNTNRQLKDLVIEIDTAMSAQLQVYASRTEDLALQSALSIDPLVGSNIQPLRNIASAIDNERDLYQYLVANTNSSSNSSHFNSVEYAPSSSIKSATTSTSYKPVNSSIRVGNNSLPSTRKISTHNESPFSTSTNSTPYRNNITERSAGSPYIGSTPTSSQPPFSHNNNNNNNNNSFTASNTQPSSLDPRKSAASTPFINPSESIQLSNPHDNESIQQQQQQQPAPTFHKSTFGSPLEHMVRVETIADGSEEITFAPDIVREAIGVVEKYGLETEGIYRKSGNNATVNNLKELIDSDPTNIKYLDPTTSEYNKDICNVAALLKQYFSALPEALLTNAFSSLLIEKAKIADPEQRKQEIHNIVYQLPDAPYWTLSKLIFHLSKVASYHEVNLMTSRNLSIIWAPSLFPKSLMNGSDMNLQSKVIDELITYCNDFFDANEEII